MIVLANGKKAEMLDQEQTYLNTLELRLFTNNFTITGATVVGDFVECTDSGYSSVVDVGFPAAILNMDDQGETTADPITWAFTFSGGAFVVYGYYFTDPADGDAFVFGENASSPFSVTGVGQTYTVVPRVQLDTLA